jgi:tape measure domain-containing protein
MSTTTEYLVKVKDLASAGFGRIQSAGTQAFGRLAQSVSTTQSRLNMLPQSINQLNARLNELTRMREVSIDRRQIAALDREIDKVEQRLNRLQRPSSGGGIGGMLPGGGLAMVAGAGLGAGALIGGIIKDEMNAVSLEVLTGSKEAGQKMLSNLKGFAAATPYSQGDLIGGATMMKSFGISNDNIIPSLKMIGDVAMGDANKLNSLSLAYSQVMSTGKLQGQDFLQFVNAGFNPLNELSKTTGKSMAQLKEEMSKGGISARDVAMAFQSATSEGGLFYGMTERMSQTLGGRLSTLKDNATEAGKSLLMMLVDPLSALMSFSTKLLEYKEVIVTVGLGWLVYSNAQNIATFATKLFTGQLFTLKAALISTGVGAILVVVGLLWNLYERAKQTKIGVEGLKTGLIGFGTAVKTTFQIMGEHISYALEKTWLKVKTFFGNVIDKPGQFLKALMYFQTFQYGKGIEAMKGLFTAGEGSEGDLAMKALEKKHTNRLAELNKQRSEGWGVAKSTFKTLYGSTSVEESGDLNLNDFAGGVASADDKAGRTAQAGARSIVVNIGKFQDNINIYSATANEALDELDRKITETFLRVLNSGAMLQQ